MPGLFAAANGLDLFRRDGFRLAALAADQKLLPVPPPDGEKEHRELPAFLHEDVRRRAKALQAPALNPLGEDLLAVGHARDETEDKQPPPFYGTISVPMPRSV